MIKRILYTLLILSFATLGWGGTAYYAYPTTCSAGTGDGSYGSPWTGMSTINGNSFSTGDDLYFNVNTDLTLTADACRLVVDWGGTSDNRVIIGCYDGNGDFDCGSTPWEDGNRPTLDGDSNTYPTNTDMSMITIGTNSYVTVKDIKIYRGGAQGISATTGDYVIVDNCYIHRNERQSIIYGTYSGGVVDGEITRNYIREQGYPSYAQQGGSIVLLGGHTAGWTTGNVVAYNNVSAGRSEGINLVKKADGNIVEYNVVYDTYFPQIYVDGAKDNIIRYNFVFRSSSYARGSNTVGILLDDEAIQTYAYSVANEIYGNFIAGHSYAGIGLSCDISKCTGVGTPVADCKGDFSSHYCHDGTKVWNNTIVDSTYNLRFSRTSSSDNIDIVNNISVLTAGDGYTMYHTNDDSPSGLNTVNDNIFYGSEDTVSGDLSAGALTTDPDLVRSLTFYNQALDTFDYDDFKQATQSAAYNSGTDLGNPTGDDTYDEDYWGTNKDTNTPWDIGAHEWDDGGTPPAVSGNLSGGAKLSGGGTTHN